MATHMIEVGTDLLKAAVDLVAMIGQESRFTAEEVMEDDRKFGDAILAGAMLAIYKETNGETDMNPIDVFQLALRPIWDVCEDCDARTEGVSIIVSALIQRGLISTDGPKPDEVKH